MMKILDIVIVEIQSDIRAKGFCKSHSIKTI